MISKVLWSQKYNSRNYPTTQPGIIGPSLRGFTESSRIRNQNPSTHVVVVHSLHWNMHQRYQKVIEEEIRKRHFRFRSLDEEPKIRIQKSHNEHDENNWDNNWDYWDIVSLKKVGYDPEVIGKNESQKIQSQKGIFVSAQFWSILWTWRMNFLYFILCRQKIERKKSRNEK